MLDHLVILAHSIYYVMMLVPLGYPYLTEQHMPGLPHFENKEADAGQLTSRLEVLVCSFLFFLLFIDLFI